METAFIWDFFVRNRYQNCWLLFSLLLHILAAIASNGYHHPDEHFQILEPIGWKLGLYGPDDLAWEFTDQIRSGMQIYVGYGVAKVLLWLDVYSPFTLTAVLRQLSGLLAFGLMVAFYKKWKVEFPGASRQHNLLLFICLLWFIPYLHVRFSSENWGGLFFFAGLYLVQYFSHSPLKYLYVFVGGLLMGLSFYFRFQMGFAIVGYVAWALVYRKFSLPVFVVFCLGGIFAPTIGTYTDYWLYDHLVITPYNYFFQNIVAGKAAGFGVSPFYSYIPMFIEVAAPPISIILLLLLCFGLWAARKTPYTWILVIFLLAHSAVGHKEFRFMFPMLLLLPLLCTIGIEKVRIWWDKIPQRIQGFSLNTLITMNCFLLVFAIAKNGGGPEGIYKAFYLVHNREPNAKIAFADKSPFDRDLKINFFNYCNNCFVKLEDKPLQPHQKLYIYTRHISGLPYFEGSVMKLKYSSLPIFPEPLSIGGWQERTDKEFFWVINTKGNR